MNLILRPMSQRPNAQDNAIGEVTVFYRDHHGLVRERGTSVSHEWFTMGITEQDKERGIVPLGWIPSALSPNLHLMFQEQEELAATLTQTSLVTQPRQKGKIRTCTSD